MESCRLQAACRTCFTREHENSLRKDTRVFVSLWCEKRKAKRIMNIEYSGATCLSHLSHTDLLNLRRH